MTSLINYDRFFHQIVGQAVAPSSGDQAFAPYAYQRQLALEPWPDMLDIPTGLGKTAAVTAAWLYRRLADDEATPRRLIWCLPMRVLVEQTRDNVESWLASAAPLFRERGLVAPRAYVLMGGEAQDTWVERPEDPAVLIGTQDMLLSRALMRGYGASRYRWPMDFALLHNDALWVLDEVQLMGAGLTTSAQLEGFRRDAGMPVVLPSRTLWASATLRPDWLDTVDFKPHLDGCRALRLPNADRGDPRVLRRLAASKQLVQARARLSASRKTDVKAFIDELCHETVAAHTGDAPTLVILNRVGRAQEVYGGLRRRLAAARSGTELLLVHARFRGAERARLNARLREIGGDDDVIVVATQAVEAGVDITSRRLFTELAPWSSLVQRFGRCNRGGEYDEAVIHWIDIDAATDRDLALPYTAEALDSARNALQSLESASSLALPPVEDHHRAAHVLRRKDLLDLFNTEPDLSGFDIDISPYLRDPGGADVQLFWRDFGERPDAQPRPGRDELCPVPIGAARDHLRVRKQRAYTWSTLDARWSAVVDLAGIRPGQVLMVRADAGGYDLDVGFVKGHRGRVEPVEEASARDEQPESMDDDRMAAAGGWIELSDHLLEARRHAEALADALPMADAGTEVIEAALYHDTGKAHPAFQTAILEHAGDEVDPSMLWAKSPNARKRLRYGIVVDGEIQRRRHFRHELASMLAWLEVTDPAASGADVDLVAYLIAAHHGKVRLTLRALPKENWPPDDRLYARGVWAGDTLPAIAVGGLRLPPLTLRLDVMRLGEGEMGPSWSARTAALLERWGPFRLAWLEAMVRLADWRASSPASMADKDPAPARGRGSKQPDRVREHAAAYPATTPTRPLDPLVLEEIVRRVIEVARPDRIILFGSAARGEMGPDSDVDLLVIRSGVEHRRRLAQDIYMNLSGVGVPVDVVVATPEDAERFGNRIGSVMMPALREGRVIYAA
jgi:CRISPR-associated endonuclease/helicase Cas3